jgi:predicted nucleic acid-binding protein
MSDIVVDSSVVAKWILTEADSAQAKDVLRRTVAAKGRLVLLDLAFSEVANVIWKQARRNLITAAESARALDELIRLPVRVEPAFPLLESAFDIGVRYDRAIYDALFVALAQNLNLPGVTADEPLFNTLHHDFPNLHLLRSF